MDFLKPPRVARTPSQEEFVIEEENNSEVDTNSRRGSLSNTSTSTDFPVTPPPTEKAWSYDPPPFKLPNIALTGKLLGLVCFLLSIALAVMVILYIGTFAPYEVCRTKDCTRTATLMLRTMDDTADPCTDFPKFACGNWLSDIASSVSVGTYDHTTIMRDRIMGRLRTLTENISDTDIPPLRQVKFLYDTCTDTTTLEEHGLSPISDLLKLLIHSNTLLPKSTSLAKSIARIKRATGQSYVFDLSISSDYRNTSVNTVFIDQPELPVDSSYLSGPDDQIAPYKKLINDAFKRLAKVPGVSPLITDNAPKNCSDRIVQFETQLADAMSDENTMVKSAMFNLFSLRELNGMYSAARQGIPAGQGIIFNWTEYVTEMFSDIPNAVITEDTEVIVMDFSYVKSVAKILTQATQEDIELYLTWRLVYSFGKDVSKDFRNMFYAFSQLLDGSETIPNRHTECLNLLDLNIPFALTFRYIQKYVSDDIIDEAHEMVKNLLKAFKDMVTSLDWMDENTKSQARLKANHMRSFLGYPKWLSNETALILYFEGLTMSNYSFFQNVLTMQSWITKKALGKINLPVDTTWSSDSPAQADAFYDDELNAITFPSGFLQEPFFGMGLRSIDYGALGSVIGHEITHGFDTRGRYSDEYGRLNSWWSIPTLMQFVQKADCFVKQYNNFYVPELAKELGSENHLDGKKTLAENIADNGGVQEAFAAYRYYIKEGRQGVPEPRLPGLEKYSPEHLFFLSFAQSWCAYNNPTSLLDSIQTNEHSPARYRVLGPLMNFEEFSNVWQCSGDTFMNPPHKCILW